MAADGGPTQAQAQPDHSSTLLHLLHLLHTRSASDVFGINAWFYFKWKRGASEQVEARLRLSSH